MRAGDGRAPGEVAMLWLWIVIGIVGAIALLFAALWVMGSRLPEEHVAGAAVRLRRPPEAVWAAVADVASQPLWSPGLTSVERLPDRAGRPAWRLTMGWNAFVTERTRAEEPRRLTVAIADERGPFSGEWDYQIQPEGEGCIVRLTERGRIGRAIPRAMVRYLVGESAYVKKHLAALSRRLGQEPEWL